MNTVRRDDMTDVELAAADFAIDAAARAVNGKLSNADSLDVLESSTDAAADMFDVDPDRLTAAVKSRLEDRSAD